MTQVLDHLDRELMVMIADERAQLARERRGHRRRSLALPAVLVAMLGAVAAVLASTVVAWGWVAGIVAVYVPSLIGVGALLVGDERRRRRATATDAGEALVDGDEAGRG